MILKDKMTRANIPRGWALNDSVNSPWNKRAIELPSPHPGHQVNPTSLSGHKEKWLLPLSSMASRKRPVDHTMASSGNRFIALGRLSVKKAFWVSKGFCETKVRIKLQRNTGWGLLRTDSQIACNTTFWGHWFHQRQVPWWLFLALFRITERQNSLWWAQFWHSSTFW